MSKRKRKWKWTSKRVAAGGPLAGHMAIAERLEAILAAIDRLTTEIRDDRA